MSAPTMQEVAKRANVALSTVSYALNGTRPVSEETRLRIWQAMSELGYQPHGNEEQGDGCEQKRATFEQRGEQHGQEGLRANQRRPIGQARPEPCRRRRFSRPSKWGAPSGLRPGPERGRGRDAAVVEADDEAVQKEGGSFVVVSVMDGAPGAG